MFRTKLKDRILPSYTKGEEIFNYVSHIIGGSIGIFLIIFSSISFGVSDIKYFDDSLVKDKSVLGVDAKFNYVFKFRVFHII